MSSVNRCWVFAFVDRQLPSQQQDLQLLITGRSAPELIQLNECRDNLQNHEPDHILPFSTHKNRPILPAGLDMIAVQFTYLWGFLGTGSPDILPEQIAPSVRLWRWHWVLQMGC